MNKNSKHSNDSHHHDMEHTVWNRRSFLQALGLTTAGSMMLGNMPVSASGASLLNTALHEAESEDRVLLIIQLDGGNDSLNTIVPVNQYDTYANNRPDLKIPQNKIIKLSDDFGIPDYMAPMQRLWGEGQMKVIHGVGYPDQSGSHFLGHDIWAGALNEYTEVNTGWMGRFFEQQYPNYLTELPEKPVAINISKQDELAFQGDSSGYSFSVINPNELQRIATSGELYDVTNVSSCGYGQQLKFVRGIINTTFKYGDVIKEAYDKSTTNADYESTRLGSQLQLVARLIKGKLGTKVYFITHPGFDTHSGQADRHQELMVDFAKEVQHFYEDLTAGKEDGNVLTLTVSEFGRRVRQNGTQRNAGTDHGAASGMMMFGTGLQGSGFVGDHPNLSDLDDNGNMKHAIDFRSIYRTVLEEWLCVDTSKINMESVLGDAYPKLNLGFQCGATSIDNSGENPSQFSHVPLYDSENNVSVEFKLPSAMLVKIELINMAGQKLGIIHNERHLPGTYRVPVSSKGRFIGQFIYKITAGKTVDSKSILLS